METRADAGWLHEKRRSPLAEGLSLGGWEAAARVSAGGPREPVGVRLRKGGRTSAGGAPVRGGGGAGGPGAPRARGAQDGYPEGETMWARGASAPRGPGRPGHEPRPSPPKHVRRRRFGAAAASVPRAWPRAGRPSLTCRDAAAEGGAPSVASAAAWAGAGQSATRRLGASSARARGVGGVGAGRGHKARLSEGCYGERRGAERLGRVQRLKGTVCCARFLLKSMNPKSDPCRPFLSCPF